MTCPACGHTNPPAQRYCGTCAAALVNSDSETVASPAQALFAGDPSRFVPGQIVADRYRMVGLLGKGGMGEVYRADDLKLGQPVALKFLPRDVETDAERLQRFLTEVRLSLRVTHPNVCRVFDVVSLRTDGAPGAAARQGDAPNLHFLSMEFVDGEDLASLLRRIGRLPEDKAVEIARQLCAGLQAAHDEGVLHRDLKPANVMIDGRGRAKITDFGLAGATAGVAGREAQAGTPQYMAPEQFDGRELSVQTDLYSLGLVLYELFTGKRAFDGATMDELRTKHSSTPTNPSAHVTGLNPIIERAILRCVDPDPGRRPRSASSLAATLPGGDPVAMAIAAGETPSPEMIAQSGGAGALTPALAIACLAAILAGLGVIWYAAGRTASQVPVPLPKPPSELQVIARSAMGAAGYKARGRTRAFGFATDDDYFRHVEQTNPSPTRWNDLGSVTPSPVWFWYRESPATMTPLGTLARPSLTNPPMTTVGMTSVLLDPAGRLQEFRAVPPELPPAPGPWTEPEWMPLFNAAGLVQSEWSATEPVWAPPHAADVRRAWAKGPMRVEAASLRGTPVWFRVVPEWRRPAEARTSGGTDGPWLLPFVVTGVQLSMLVGAAVLARRNVRHGRSDRRGALRFAAVYLIIGIGVVLTSLTTIDGWFGAFQRGVAAELYGAATIWLVYLAIEPYVRRLWPGTLVSWSRVLEGRVRDPLVGRDILFGALAGLTFSLLLSLSNLWSTMSGVPPAAPSTSYETLATVSGFIRAVLDALQHSFAIPVAALLGVLLLRVAFRRPWLAYTVLFVLAGLAYGIGETFWGNFVSRMLTVALMVLVLTRLGLFAFLVAVVFTSCTLFAITTDTTAWYFWQSVILMALLAGLAVYGFWISLGQQKVFRDVLE